MSEAPGALPLDQLQRWFHGSVTHPDGVHAGAGDVAIADVLRGPVELDDPASGVGIYAGMYFARLLEVLEQDFPALAAHLGDGERTALFRAYLVEHPSTHPNLNRLGARLPGFLAEHRPGFVAELARLERSIQEVFDAPRADTLSSNELARVPQSQWAELTLDPAPSVRLHAFTHPVNDWYQAYRDDDTRPTPVPEASHLVVYRREGRVWRLPLEPDAHALLASLAGGATLGQALQERADAGVLETVLPQLGSWFQDWSGLGLFRSRG